MSNSLNTIRFLSRKAIVSTGLAQQAQSESIQRLVPVAANAVRRFTSVRTSSNVAAGANRKPLHPPTFINTKFNFSSIAEQEEELSATPSSKPPRQRQKRKDPILITPAAADRIKELLSSPNGEGALGIRLGVKRRGCNGLSYTLNYAFEKQPNEEEMEAHGVKVMIEPMALFNVVGTVMDWEETDMSSEFTFENPNSKGECGCGESFNV